jgi:hypothetical protein
MAEDGKSQLVNIASSMKHDSLRDLLTLLIHLEASYSFSMGSSGPACLETCIQVRNLP